MVQKGALAKKKSRILQLLQVVVKSATKYLWKQACFLTVCWSLASALKKRYFPTIFSYSTALFPPLNPSRVSQVTLTPNSMHPTSFLGLERKSSLFLPLIFVDFSFPRIYLLHPVWQKYRPFGVKIVGKSADFGFRKKVDFPTIP